MGEFTVVDNGEKTAPLEELVPPPPPPMPPPPRIEPAVEAKCDPEGVWALNLGEDTDCPGCWCCCWSCCCEPDWKAAKGDDVEAGEGALRPPERPLVELSTAEKEEVKGEEVEAPGPGLLD